MFKNSAEFSMYLDIVESIGVSINKTLIILFMKPLRILYCLNAVSL
jgi:hypothetical protein